MEGGIQAIQPGARRESQYEMQQVCSNRSTMDTGVKTLHFVQIYFEPWQTDHLYPFAFRWFNEHPTNYFENAVIAQAVPTISHDLISVCSWRLAKKRGDMWRLSDKTLTVEKILGADYDIAVLTPRSPRHRPLEMSSKWHGAAWDNAFGIFKKQFLPTIGIRCPEELTHAIYENHFIAQRDIYHRYVDECLIPAMHFIDQYPGLESNPFLADSGYARRKTDGERKAYFEKTGRHDWPIAPFILERLFSIWIEGKGYKIINL